MKTCLRRLVGLPVLAVILALGACAALPPPDPQRLPSTTRVAPADAPLAAIATEAGVPAGRSGARVLQISAYALDARLSLIRNARVSLDLQTYLIADDGTGRLILRELRDAAQRGVRVRLLLDDMYTDGMTELLLGLAAHPNVELRLFNPFAYGRETPVLKLWNFVADFRRLNHRMHNKLFVADGVAAIVGGRNLADEYFFRSREGNFIDFELLAVGALVPQLSRYFDDYWNSRHVYPVQQVADWRLDADERRRVFAHLTAGDTAPPPPAGPDPLGVPPLSQTLQSHRHGLIVADAACLADPPDKVLGALPDSASHPGGVMARTLALMREARSDIVVFSPYFVPGRPGMAHLREARAHGIAVAVVTNAMAASDEPLVSEGYGRYRQDMLQLGVQLYEISSDRLHRDGELRHALGSSVGRLHAKVALIDRSVLLVGSMNLDPRSALTNTELGVAVRSPELAEQAAAALKVDDRRTGVFEVRLNPARSGLEWVGRDEDREQTLTDEPEASLWQRFKIKLMSLWVPEELL